MQRTKIKCLTCNKEISKSNFSRHVCKKNIIDEYVLLVINDKTKCPFCNKEYSKYGIKNHISITHLKNRLGPMSNRSPWNKGLSINDNPELKNKLQAGGLITAKKYSSEEWSEINKSKWTEDLRKKQSNIKKELYEKFPEKHPNRKLANNRINLSYPEKLCINYFEENNIKFTSQQRIGNKYPDFIIDENIIIEVDGERWHKDINKENERDAYFQSLGYKVFHISAKNVIKNLIDILSLNSVTR